MVQQLTAAAAAAAAATVSCLFAAKLNSFTAQ
jgi:hypothetical protein